MPTTTPVLNPALWTASREGRAEEVRRFLVEGAAIEERGGTSACTSLHIACSYGREEVLLLLLQHGALVSVTDNDGRSPLHHAAIQGQGEVTRILLELKDSQRADVSAQDKEKSTPLHYAAYMGRESVAMMLLGKEADLQSKTNAGRTPEDTATVRFHFKVAGMIKAEEERREAVHRAQCVAFAMGHQERLGLGSWVQELDAGVVQMVLERV
ncbi:ankyrin repeat-containing domain protein [Baffinella frigidus]|nr:ankyrin repeat-containing domain protein [Cryptophyta sp. CCMP2293]